MCLNTLQILFKRNYTDKQNLLCVVARVRAQNYLSHSASEETVKYLPSCSLNTYWQCNTNTIFYFKFLNTKNNFFWGNKPKNMFVFLDRRGPRWGVFETILYTEVKFWTTRLASSTLHPSQLLVSKTTFRRFSGHTACPTWLWSSSGYFCVSCPCSSRLFRRDLRCWLPSRSL